MAERQPRARIVFGEKNLVQLAEPELSSQAHFVFPVARRDRKTGAVQLMGSAFYLGYSAGSALFATARHIFESNEFSVTRYHWKDPEFGRRWQLFVALPDGQELVAGLTLTPVTQISLREQSSDAALLNVDVEHLSSDELATFATSRLDLSRPELGDRCVSLGWTTTDAGFWTLVASQGVIEQFYEAGVAPGKYYPYPCIQLDTRSPSGMSGGPVLSARSGGIIAFVCSGSGSDTQAGSGLDTTEDVDLKHWTFASHIATIGDLSWDAKIDGQTREVSVQDMLSGGFPFLAPSGSVTLTRNEADEFRISWSEPPSTT